jgi:hypothetical protein
VQELCKVVEAMKELEAHGDGEGEPSAQEAAAQKCILSTCRA